MLLSVYQRAVDVIVLAIEFVVTYSVHGLLVEHTRQLKRMCAVSVRRDCGRQGAPVRPEDLDADALVETLEQMLTRQLSFVRTLILLNQCFKA